MSLRTGLPTVGGAVLINKEDNPQWIHLIWAFSQFLLCFLGVSGLHNLKTTANQGSVYQSLGTAGWQRLL